VSPSLSDGRPVTAQPFPRETPSDNGPGSSSASGGNGDAAHPPSRSLPRRRPARSRAFIATAYRRGEIFAGGSWIVDPEGEVLARTSADTPIVTVDIDLSVADRAKQTYPRNVVD
jgi:predicted amidohydrolase